MTDFKEQRLFVGNLPTNITESNLKDLFKGLQISDFELKRKNALDREVVFAYVNIPTKQVDRCLKRLNGYKWKSHVLNVQIAKENFLDRLKKERSQRSQIDTNVKATPNSYILNNCAPKNKKIKFDSTDEGLNSEKQGASKRRRSSSLSSEDESSIPRKRNLPMFRGISDVKYGEKQIEQKSSSSNTIPAKEEAEKCDTDVSMKRFEDFSSVWRDDTPADCFQYGNTDLIRDSHTYGKKSPIEKNSNLRSESGRNVEERKCEPEKNSRRVSEMKRQTALEEKWNSIKEKKKLVQNALKNISSKEETQKRGPKMTLFDHDSSEEDTFEPNFEVKSYLGGDDGLKRLNLKAKLANDERFQIDERFFDDGENESEPTDSRKKGRSLGSITRYDPSIPILPSTQSTPAQTERKVKKTKAKSNKLGIEHREQAQTTKPEVSKEKHYSVCDNLKEVFKKHDEGTSFSLSAMFETRLELRKYNDTHFCGGVIVDNFITDERSDTVSTPSKEFQPRRNSLDSPIVPDNENTDEENEAPMEIVSVVPSEKVLGKCGVWGETFFFRSIDSRLKEAASFYQFSDRKEDKDFGKRRKQLKSIVKKRIQNSRRDKNIFRRKLGGKINRTKFRMRLKKIDFDH